ncbi:MAG: GIY-YIG nuclease family protein [Candidatus Aminicenantes bacterium]|nr:GIY-YIG nuclease family protein [Candidatus Aminicenantes bacterium]
MKAKAEGSVSESAAVWHLYILCCGDGSFYTGVTTDIERRFREHQEGTASRYTRTHRPVGLVHREECGTRSQALSRECAVKTLSREKKEALVAGGAKPKAAGAGKTLKTKKAAPKRKR